MLGRRRIIVVCFAAALLAPGAAKGAPATKLPPNLKPELQKKIDQASEALLSGRYKDVIKIAESILADNPSVAEAHLYHGIGMSYLGKSGIARNSLNQAARLTPNSSRPYVERGFNYFYYRKWREWDDLPSGDFIPKWWNGPERFRKNFLTRMEAARRDAEIAIQADPRDDDGYELLGKIYFDDQQYDRALKAFTKAIDVASGNAVGSHRERGRVYLELGKYRAAVSDLTTFLPVAPKPEFIKYWRGYAYAVLNDREDAMKDLAGALESRPRCLPIIRLKARVEFMDKALTEPKAIRDYLEPAWRLRDSIVRC